MYSNDEIVLHKKMLSMKWLSAIELKFDKPVKQISNQTKSHMFLQA